MRILSSYDGKRIAEIHALSARRAADEGMPHRHVLVSMIMSHAREIDTCLDRNDNHAAAETADLAILCLELLMEMGVDPDRVFDARYRRFIEKISFTRKRTKGDQ